MRPFWFQAMVVWRFRLSTLPNGVTRATDDRLTHLRSAWTARYGANRRSSSSPTVALRFQVNFRGSGGFGKKFEKSGYRKWGGRIQQDIVDATKFVMDRGIAAKDRTCIYGASFGGYSALQAPVVAPGLYQCAVGLVGVYDLDLLYNDGDVRMRKAGRNYLEEVIGRDEAELRKFFSGLPCRENQPACVPDSR